MGHQIHYRAERAQHCLQIDVILVNGHLLKLAMDGTHANDQIISGIEILQLFVFEGTQQQS
jgi:uncharacterized protein (UPF0303 family)